MAIAIIAIPKEAEQASKRPQLLAVPVKSVVCKEQERGKCAVQRAVQTLEQNKMRPAKTAQTGQGKKKQHRGFVYSLLHLFK